MFFARFSLFISLCFVSNVRLMLLLRSWNVFDCLNNVIEDILIDLLFGILLGDGSLIDLSRHMLLLFFGLWLVNFFLSVWHVLFFFRHVLLFLLFFRLLTAVVLMAIVLLTVVVDELDSALALEFDWLEGDLLDDHAFLALLVEVLSAAKTAAKRECALLGISVGRRVGHTKRAVDAVAIADFDLVVWLFAVLVVASLTEEVSAEAMPDCN